MMGDILSLSKARKARVKAEKEQLAAENRVRFGRSKAEKARDKLLRAKADSTHEEHKRET